MPYINDAILDLALARFDVGASRLDICKQEPADFTGATTTHTLGYKTSLSVGAPTDRTPNGRKVVVAAITDGTVVSSGTATHWGISDGTVLMASGSLSASQVVTAANTFTLAAFDLGIPDAV